MLGEDNAIFGDTTFLTDWKMRFALQKVKVDAGSGKFLWADEGNRVVAFPALASNQMPRSTARRGTAPAGSLSTLMFFSPSQVLFGTWGTDDILVDPYTRRNQGYIVLSTYAHHDFQCRHAVSVVRRQHVLNT